METEEMNEDETILIASAHWFLNLLKDRRNKEKRKKRTRKFWVNPFLLQRDRLGIINTIVPEFRSNGHDKYYSLNSFLRFCPEVFDFILQNLKEELTPKYSPRKPISPYEKLVVCLRFLATGNSFTDLWTMTRIHKSTIHNIIEEVCCAIIKILGPIFLQTPSKEDEWNHISDGFENTWQFVNTIGSIDGKHIRIRKPHGAGSSYWNYKKFDSIVLLAIVDHRYRFSHAEVGINGIISDGGVFENSLFLKIKDQLNIPEGKFLVGDGAFPLRSYIMKPYSGQCNDSQLYFNKRISRARVTCENTFGLMVARWRVLLTTLNVNVDLAKKITLSCCILHNLFIDKQRSTYLLSEVDYFRMNGTRVDGAWRRQLSGHQLPCGLLNSHRNETENGIKIRDYYKNYYLNHPLPWEQI